MAKKKTKSKKPAKPAPPAYPIVFETFRAVGVWERNQMEQVHPSAFNGQVRVKRYRVTIEEIEESDEVIRERLLKLWREDGNYHHVDPLRAMAKKYGLELNMEDFGRDRPPRVY